MCLLGRIKALYFAIRKVKSETPMLQDGLISVCTRVPAITRSLSREKTSQKMLAVKNNTEGLSQRGFGLPSIVLHIHKSVLPSVLLHCQR